MERRDFFTSLGNKLKGESPKAKDLPLRPPYNRDESLFLNECHKCNAVCATVCEEDIILIASDKTPYLSFSSSGCTFCDDCAVACEFGVLDVKNGQQIYANIDISPDSCLAWNQTMCFSCKDPCLDNAIIFQGLFKPVIDMSKCTACGFCISRCPTEAIKVEILDSTIKKDEEI